MRAFVFTKYGGPENQQFVDVSVPVPEANELLVKVRAAGVNPKDRKVREGISERLDHIERSVGLGREAAGVVVALGSSVNGFEIGDEVFGSVIVGETAGIAEFARLRAARSVHKPERLSFTDAGGMSLVFATAFDAVEQLALSPGALLLIIGIGGGVGIAATQIAVARGIPVIGTASSGKEAFVSSFGATHVAYGEGVAACVRETTNGAVDGIIDCVGNGALRELAGLVREPSQIVSVTDAETAEHLGGGKVRRTRDTRALEECVRLVEVGSYRPYVTEVFSFDRAAEAMERIESGHAMGKVVVEIP